MKTLVFDRLWPSDKLFPGLYCPGGRAPADAGQGHVPGKCHILEMIAHNLGIPKIMKLIYQAVVNRFMLCVPDRLHPDRTQLFEGAVDGGLFHMDNSGRSVGVIGTPFRRWVFDQAFSVKCQQQFPAGHVLEPATGLYPVPVLAQFPEIQVLPRSQCSLTTACITGRSPAVILRFLMIKSSMNYCISERKLDAGPK